MKKTASTPLWVFLAFSSIESRKSALILIWSCVLFTIYCLPWAQFFTDIIWVKKIFLIDDWSWFAMMIPMTAWYVISLKWIDKNQGWDYEPIQQEG